MDYQNNDLNQFRIERPFYEHQQLRDNFCYEKPGKINAAKKWSENFRIKKLILSFFPITGWFHKYNWKRDFLFDVISGLTVAVMHIPQGMAYAMLGNVPPVYGIYVAFFPVLVYFFFGTAKHNSMGTFSIACLMTGRSVLAYSDPSYFPSKNDILNNGTIVEPTGYSPIQVAASVTFVVAIFQLSMFLLRLGMVSALLSETLVSGFTTGAVTQVLVFQLKDLLGLTLPAENGYFSTILVLKNVIEQIDTINIAALIISTVTITLSVINNDYLKKIVAKKSPIPFPMELAAVVIGTLVSKYCSLVDNYNIRVVGNISVGLPVPNAPPFDLLPKLLVNGLTIAIVSYTYHLSMALIFAQKFDYEVDANQELFALGISNAFGSFFSCMPFSSSLTRSLIQQVAGGVSQIQSIVSCLILLIVLLWIGPFFEDLPKAVLASILVVALKGMLMQIRDFWKFWKLSKMDALVWMGTFLTVLLISIEIGLLCGIILSLGSIFFLSFKPHTCLLGQIPNTDLYLDIARYKAAKEIDGVKIFHYSGGINFATKFMFKNDLVRLVGLNPQKEVIYRVQVAKYLEKSDEKQKSVEASDNLSNKLEKAQNKANMELRYLILDFSSVSYIDPSGVAFLKSLIENINKLDISVYIASCKEPVYEMLTKVYPDHDSKTGFKSFPTVHDAVYYSTGLFESKSISSVLSTIT